MNRRFFGCVLLAALAGCSGAGVSSTDLREKVSGEVAQVVINLEQLGPWISEGSVTLAQLNTRLTAVQSRVAASHAAGFTVPELHDLRRFYSSPDGQAVTALAYAAEGGRARPPMDAEQFARVEAAFNNPVIAKSVSILRDMLRQAFTAEFSF
jgi:hypothetical protein